MLGGVQLVMLGVIGEYIWRNSDETRKRPAFVIELELNEETNSKDEHDDHVSIANS
jgi:dolichol-phosphate mannosyltransferase